MITLPGTSGVFSVLINQMEAGRLLGGIQFHALSHFSQILAADPEGRETAALINEELNKSPDRIEFVPRPIIAALRGSSAILDRAVATSSHEAVVVEAFRKLQRIVQLTGNGTGISQTMPAVVDPAALARASGQIRQGRARVESPALRYLERLRRETSENQRLPVFSIDGKIVHISQKSDLLDLLSRHFGSPVTQQTLHQLFGLNQENCRIASVDIRREGQGRLRIAGEIRHENDRGGFFGMIIPPMPESGSPWTAKVEAISVVKGRLGIGSALLYRVALFLHEMGVHAMEANAMEGAGLFCVFNGFRIGKSLYEDLVTEFVGAMREKGVAISDDKIRTQLLDRESNLAELAAFEVGGKRVGREFLNALFSRKYLPVKFELSADKQSWLRLLSNLHRNQKNFLVVPSEWDGAGAAWQGLRSETRMMLLSGAAFVGGNVLHLMSSDRDHAVHLVERLNNWAQTIAMMMAFPRDMIDRLPEERRTVIAQQQAAITDILAMLGADPSSSLFTHFWDLMDPGAGGFSGSASTNRGFFIASTMTTASQKGLVTVPRVLARRFEELLLRED